MLVSNGKNSCNSEALSPCSEKTYLPSIAPGCDVVVSSIDTVTGATISGDVKLTS